MVSKFEHSGLKGPEGGPGAFFSDTNGDQSGKGVSPSKKDSDNMSNGSGRFEKSKQVVSLYSMAM